MTIVENTDQAKDEPVRVILESSMLKVHIKKTGNVAIVHLKGGIVTGETASLRNAVQSQSDVSMVVLDFCEVSMLDAGGLGLLLKLRQETQAKGIEFRLMNVTKLVRKVFEITRLNSVFAFTYAAELQSKVGPRRSGGILGLTGCAQRA
jgi:anti-anti-sigma factor